MTQTFFGEWEIFTNDQEVKIYTIAKLVVQWVNLGGGLCGEVRVTTSVSLHPEKGARVETLVSYTGTTTLAEGEVCAQLDTLGACLGRSYDGYGTRAVGVRK